MKVKYLIAFVTIIFNSVHFAKGQDFSYVKSIGYFIDINQNEVNNYVDLDYDAPTEIYHNFSQLSDYSPGSYYDLNGVRHFGEIKRIDINKTISFKKDKDSKPVKIRSVACTAFTVGVDSFIVRNNIIVQRGLGPHTMSQPQFMGVVVDNDEMTVFKHKYDGTQYISSYLVYLKESSEYFSIPKKNRNFIKVVVPLIKSYNHLYEKVNSGELDYDDFSDIAASYDYYVKFKSGKPLFFTKNWNETKDKNKAIFKGIIENEADSVFTISYYNNAGDLVAKGNYSSFFPLRKNGAFEWYYPGGRIRKKGNFKNNDPDGVFTAYYPSGNPYEEFTINDEEKKYRRIWNEKGEVVMENGAGMLTISDDVNSRKITRVYQQGILAKSYFKDKAGDVIFQKKEDEIVVRKAFIKYMNENLEYPSDALKVHAQGSVLVSLKSDKHGSLDELKIVKGVHPSIDKHVIAMIRSFNTQKILKPLRMANEKVRQEVLLPVSFGISTDYVKQRWYFNDPFFHQHHMMMHQPINITPPPMPGRF